MEFKVRLTAKELWQFSVYNANKGMLGLVNLIFTAAALFLLVTQWGNVTVPYRFLLILCSMLFTVWQPATLYWKARKQAKKPAARNEMTLTFTDEGLKVQQNEQEGTLTWEQIFRAERISSMIIIYTDRIHAFLLPKAIMGVEEEGLRKLLKEKMPAYRRKHI